MTKDTFVSWQLPILLRTLRADNRAAILAGPAVWMLQRPARGRLQSWSEELSKGFYWPWGGGSSMLDPAHTGLGDLISSNFASQFFFFFSA